MCSTALIIAWSLLVVSWVTALGSVVAVGGDAAAARAVAGLPGRRPDPRHAGPARARPWRRLRTASSSCWPWASAASRSRTAPTFPGRQERYSSADLVSSGWVIGFLLPCTAGLMVHRSRRSPHGSSRSDGPAVVAGHTAATAAAAVRPPVAAVVALVTRRMIGATTPTVNLLLGSTLVILVLVRQFLAITDNQRLLVALGAARDQLEHQALHDPLTGLANRALFADRLDRALLHPEGRGQRAHCDLDDFKSSTTSSGMSAGDLLLQRASRSGCSSASARLTILRLGGDEFAILLETSAGPIENQPGADMRCRKGGSGRLNYRARAVPARSGFPSRWQSTIREIASSNAVETQFVPTFPESLSDPLGSARNEADGGLVTGKTQTDWKANPALSCQATVVSRRDEIAASCRPVHSGPRSSFVKPQLAPMRQQASLSHTDQHVLHKPGPASLTMI